jgi:DNA-binding NtrC family response regulator
MADQLDPATTGVLIVEDSTHYSLVLERLLSRGLGYKEISVVASTQDAYNLLKADPGKFTILFVDYHFPTGDNGAELLSKLKDEGILKDKIALVITSDPSLENAKAATDAGAMGLVAKPFDAHQLKVQLEKAKRMFFADSQQYF